MKMINTKTYFLMEVLETGQCTLCGTDLEWQTAPFEPKIQAVADCCNFVYLLKPIDKVVDEEPSVTAHVLPRTAHEIQNKG